MKETGLIYRIKVVRTTRHKTDHFGDDLPSQSLGVLLKKLNLAHRMHTYTKVTN